MAGSAVGRDVTVLLDLRYRQISRETGKWMPHEIITSPRSESFAK